MIQKFTTKNLFRSIAILFFDTKVKRGDVHSNPLLSGEEVSVLHRVLKRFQTDLCTKSESDKDAEAEGCLKQPLSPNGSLT